MTGTAEETDSLSLVGKVRGTSPGPDGVDGTSSGSDEEEAVASVGVDVDVDVVLEGFDSGVGATSAKVGVDGDFVVDWVQVAKRFVTCSRSRRMKKKARRTKAMRTMSSRLVREWTKCSPSMASRPAATQAKNAERKSFHAMTPRRKIVRVPMIATVKRQPNESSAPKRSMPQPMSHLPRGGWTTYSGVDSMTLGSPALKESSALSGQERS